MIFCIDPDQDGVTVFTEPGVQVRDILTAIALANLSYHSPHTPPEKILYHEAEMSKHIKDGDLRLTMLLHCGVVCPLNVEVTSVTPCIRLRMTAFATDVPNLLQRAAVFIESIEGSNQQLRDVVGKLASGTN